MFHSRCLPRRYAWLLAVSLPLSLLLADGGLRSAIAQSIIPAMDGTGTQVIPNGNQFDIQGGSLSADQLNLFHSLQEFGLTEGQIANFLANPSLRNIVTRVGGGTPSVIDGLLQVTGGTPNLYLMNPSGVIFGPNAQLNVPASFAVTTGDGIQFGDRTFSAVGNTDYATLLGDPTGFTFGENSGGLIINSGTLTIPTGETLTLLGGTVVNTGQLSAPEGQILITALPGESTVRLALPGYILEMAVELPPNPDNQPRTWQVPITMLPTLLTTGLTPEMLGLSVTDTGTVELANGVTIPDYPGTTMVSGALDVSGSEGGSIAVLGDRVGLVNSTLDASGTNGGGTLLVGGDFQGNGTVPNATRTYVNATSTLAADATLSGDGGTVIVWADQATGFYGDITATGGTLSGNGGFAEVSGRENLRFEGLADLSSQHGKSGTLVLDPDNIVISNNPDKATILQSTIQAQSLTASIELVATNSIEIGELELDKETATVPTLEFGNEGIGNAVTFLVSNGDFTVTDPNSRLVTNGGNLVIEANNITTGLLETNNALGNAGDVILTATEGDISTDIRAIARNESDSIRGDGGSITLNAQNGNVTVNNNLVSFSANGDAGKISIEAGKNITIKCNSSAIYCIESFGGGIEDIPSRGNSGDISFTSKNGTIQIFSPANTDATINAGNDAFAGGNITLQAPKISLGGKFFSGGVTGSGDIQLIGDSITLLDNLELRAGEGEIKLGSNSSTGLVDGSFDFTLESNSVIILNGEVGSDIPVKSLSMLGSGTFFPLEDITASGTLLTQGTVNAVDTPLRLTVNDLELTGIFEGSENLEINTFDSGRPIILDEANLLGEANQDSLNLSSTEIKLLRGFSNVTIGGGSGDISINAPVTFNTPTTLTTTGTINANANVATTGQDLSLTKVALGDDVTFSTGANSAGDLTFQGGISGINNDLTLSTGTGTIQFQDDVTVGSLQIESAGQVQVGADITTQGTPLTFNAPVVLTDPSAIATGNAAISFNNTLDSETGETNALALRAGNGNIAFNGAVGAVQTPGNVTLESFQALTTKASVNVGGLQQATGFTSSGNIILEQPLTTDTGGVTLSTTGDLSASTITTNNGDVNLTAQNNLAINTITTNGGDITLSSTNTPFESSTALSSASTVAEGGNVTITNPIAITTGDIDASGATMGGNVTVLANDSITVGKIDTSATQGNGGNVLLDPLGDVQVSFINAQGGTEVGATGVGGTVDITTIAGRFRATDSFKDQNNIVASISAAGRTVEGRIIIRHNGGDLFEAFNLPFTAFDNSVNGTVGALTTGANNVIGLPNSFPGPYTQGRIDIITSPRFTNALNQALPETLPEEVEPADTAQRPFPLDEYFTRRMEAYLGFETPTPIKSLEQIQDDLRRIEEATGVRPALIYVMFEPKEVLTTLPEDGSFLPEALINEASLYRFNPAEDDILQLILVTAQGDPILRRPDDPEATRANVPDRVRQLREGIQSDLSLYIEEGTSAPNRYLPHAHTLYQWLVDPLLEDLEAQGIENLVFIMDDGLRSTPLAALLPTMYDGEHFIVENFSVGLMPSFSLTDTEFRDIRTAQVLAMGMSDFSEYRTDGYSNLQDLMGVRDEITLINERLWPSAAINSDPLLDEEEFTLENLVSIRQERPASILHLATHSKFEADIPDKSYVAFFNEPLFFNEFRRLGFTNPPVDLLVLSSCQTAMGTDDNQYQAELGFAGLSVQAGVRSSLASLWDVNDVGTLGLMAEFYSQLHTAPIKAIALQRAQIAMIRREVFLNNDDDQLVWSSDMTQLSFSTQEFQDTESLSVHLLNHPGYWAGFTLIGNPW